jgi:hypothetical protein
MLAGNKIEHLQNLVALKRLTAIVKSNKKQLEIAIYCLKIKLSNLLILMTPIRTIVFIKFN